MLSARAMHTSSRGFPLVLSALVCLSAPLASLSCGAGTGPVSDGEGHEEQEHIADTADVRAKRRPLSSQPELLATLDALGDVAAFGASLQAFSYKEDVRVPRTGCTEVDASEAALEFDEIVDTVWEGGDQSEAPQLNLEKLAEAKAAFRVLLGEERYKVCVRSGGEGWSFVRRTLLAGIGGGVKVEFELAWED